jgi:hypothetical protein
MIIMTDTKYIWMSKTHATKQSIVPGRGTVLSLTCGKRIPITHKDA